MALIGDAWRQAWAEMPAEVQQSVLTGKDGAPSKRAFTAVFPTIFRDFLPAELRTYRAFRSPDPISDGECQVIIDAIRAQADTVAMFAFLIDAVNSEFRVAFGHADPNHDRIYPLALAMLKELSDGGDPTGPADFEELRNWVADRIVDLAVHHPDASHAPFTSHALESALSDPAFINEAVRMLSEAWRGREMTNAFPDGGPSTSLSAEAVLRALPLKPTGWWDRTAESDADDMWARFLGEVRAASERNWDVSAVTYGLVREKVTEPELLGWSNEPDIPPLDLSIRQRCDVALRSAPNRNIAPAGSVAQAVGHMIGASAAPLGVASPESRATLVLAVTLSMDPTVTDPRKDSEEPKGDLRYEELAASSAMRRRYLNLAKHPSSGPITTVRMQRENDPTPSFARKLWSRLIARELRDEQPRTAQEMWETIIRAWSSWVRHTVGDFQMTRPAAAEAEPATVDPAATSEASERLARLKAENICAWVSDRLSDLLFYDEDQPLGLGIRSLVARIREGQENAQMLRDEYRAAIRRASEALGDADWPDFDLIPPAIELMGRNRQ